MNNRRDIILKHYKSPKHRGLVTDKNYLTSDSSNDSCIDSITVMVKVFNNVIEDICFDGEACAICIASSSIMTDTVIGKSIDEVKEIIKNVFSMLEGNDYDKNLIGEVNVFDDIYKQPNRIMCVSLPWLALNKIINN